MPGKIILVNGASSSGKSTLCRALQDGLPEPYWHYSIDHFRESGMLPLDRIRSGEFSWREMRPAFFEGFHQTLPVLAAAGNNLIVEHIVETEEWLRLLLKLLAAVDVFLVGVHCPLDELERREAARGDRPIGDARRDFETIHQLCIYDLEIDSTVELTENVQTIIQGWHNRTRPTAFERMAEIKAKLSSANT